MKIYAVCTIVILLFSSCAKEKQNITKIDDLANRYGLSKIQNYSGAVVTKEFNTVEDFELFLKKRSVSVSDTMVITRSKADSIKSMRSVSYELEDGDADFDSNMKNENIFTFPQFADAGYPDKVLVQYISPFIHNCYYSGPNFGFFNYNASPGRSHITLGFRYTGIYTEIYSFGGPLTWYRNFQFTLDLITISSNYTAIAKFSPL